MKKLILIIVLVSICVIISIVYFTKKNDWTLRKKIESFVTVQICIPYERLDFKKCIEFKDSIDDKDIKLVFYNDSISCLDCTFTKMAEYLQENHEKLQKVRIIHIISVNSKDSEYLFRKLCNIRLYGEVYLDTCNAFVKVNPKLPKEELFHTFLLDKDDKVVFVGNPSNNSRTENVFWKTISYCTNKK